jgi:hypothetical protein
MVVYGRCFTSVKTLARYTPITPSESSVSPPRNQTDTINEGQPSRSTSKNKRRISR